ncbi:MAG: TonB-dependent receptor [Deltaproteobacteria bacterium]|nr:MAG: TonB-dependent receptor [Deltaproteobacteria bacterium]
MPPACATPWRVHRCRRGIFAVALVAAVSVPARAQDAAARTDEGPARTELPEVEIVAERPHGSLRAPGSETTVVEANRFAGEVRSVAELLATSPGVSVHALGGPGQAATLSLRGASADQSAVLLDGIPLQGPGGSAVDLATLPATLLDRVIISRGVLGAQFGAGALGGAAELVPRAPGNDAFRGGATLTAGSFGSFGLAADAAGALRDGTGAVAAVQVDRTAGDFTYQRQLTPEIDNAPWFDQQRANADARRVSALARVAQRISPASEIDLLLQGSMGSRGLPGPEASITPLSRELDASGLAGVRLKGVEGSAVYAMRAWGRSDGVELRGASALGSCTDGTADCPRIPQSSSALRLEAEGGVPVGSAHWLRSGIAAGGDFISGTESGRRRRAIVSASLADDIEIGIVSLHPAVRFDAVGKQLGASPAIAASASPFTNGALAPLELRAGAGLSFRSPTFSELYLRQGGLAPNPDLTPEHAFSFDAGLGWRARALTVRAGAFWSRYRDLIVYEQFPPLAVKPFNVGAARIAGIELQAVAALPYGFTAEAAYSFLSAENLRPGRLEGHTLSYRPPHRLFVRAAHRGDRTEAYAEANFTASMPRNQFDTAFLPSQLLINAGAGARLAGPVWLDVEAKNLLDDRRLQDLFQYPLPGLSLAAIVRVRL